MESLEAKKVRLLGKYLSKANDWTEAQNMFLANSIICLLDEIEQAYWITREEADFQTHFGEVYHD